MKCEVLRKQLKSDLKIWRKQVDQLPRGRRYFQQYVDGLNLPLQLDNYDSTVYDDAEEYIESMAKNNSEYEWLKNYDVPVAQLVRYFNDYSQGDKRLNHYIIFPTKEYAKAYIRQQKIEKVKEMAGKVT